MDITSVQFSGNPCVWDISVAIYMDIDAFIWQMCERSFRFLAKNKVSGAFIWRGHFITAGLCNEN